jgi:metalloendopeptidase OMA1, mitochondrial
MPEICRLDKSRNRRLPRSFGSSCFLLAALAVTTLVGCDVGVPGENGGGGQGPGHRPQHLALHPDEEVALGEQAYRQVLSESRGRVLPSDDPRVQKVRAIARRIVRAAGIEPLQREINLNLRGYRFEWEANVIADRRVNAFCLPGGKIIVYTGILPVAENDAQLATVLSHEIAHALAHHSNERVTREDSGRVNVLLNKAFDRRQESEADHIGIFLMTFAGYDPEEALRFWVRMSQLHQGGNIPEFLSDHPSDEHRIRDMQKWVPMALAAKKAFDEGRIAPPTR